eukprot:6978476-Alexandrium_andersonii.AAC.1
MKPGAVEGLGVGKTPGDWAANAIKLMACDLIKLAVVDEAAAIDGSRRWGRSPTARGSPGAG